MESFSQIMRRSLPNQEPARFRWTCPVCGVIEPRTVLLRGKQEVYYRASCACQKAQRIQEQQEQQRKETNKKREECYARAYTWLGDHWHDIPLQAKTFESFQQQSQQQAYDEAWYFAGSTTPSGILALYGSFGTGKTHLLAAIVNHVIEQYALDCAFMTAPKFFAAIGQRINEKQDYIDFIERAIRVPLLIIDDIDKAKRTEFREEVWFNLVDERIKRDLPIAFSTNRLDQLPDYVGGAVASRLKIGQIAVPMFGSDYREEM